VAVVLLAVALASCGSKGNLPSRTAAEWRQMAEATENEETAKSQQVKDLLQKSLASDEPMWPVDTFLRAELYRLRGDTGEARKTYRALAEWGTTDPYKDGWGGSGLSVIALWRWVEISKNDSVVNDDEVAQILDCDRKLRSTRFATGMFSAPLLGTLPQMEEEIVRGLARLAWLARRKEEAERLFLQYLQLARTKERDEVEEQLWWNLLATKQASEDRLTLLVATRLSVLGQNPTAEAMFREILGSNDPEVRAQAEFHLASLERLSGKASRQAVVDRLTAALQDAADPQLSQQILFALAEAYNRPGKDRDTNAAAQDLQQLISDFPEGSLANSALYQLALYYQGSENTEEALKYFGKLQGHTANNPRYEQSYHDAALALYARAAPGDLTKAAELLQKVLKERPNSTLRLAALFWLGRLAEESGDTQQAQTYFRQILRQSSYDYYAIRARMHMNLGPKAKLTLFPDEQTTAELGAAYPVNGTDARFPTNSTYARCLREALQTGLYLEGIKADERLRHLHPSKRLQDLSHEELDSSHQFSRVALLLAFREDAQAASDVHADGRLQIAAAIGQLAQDWPLAISLSSGISQPDSPQAGNQQNTRFLAAAYPIVFAGAFRSAAMTSKVQPELLYAVARRESRFYPAALSPPPVGALGLFQFIPSTFKTLDKKWNLLRNSGVSSPEEFLLNPDLSIQLGGRWFHEELLPRNKGDVLAAIVEHNVNREFVEAWSSKLRAGARSGDVECAVESIIYLDTRAFVKGVLADMAVIASAGALRAPSQAPVPVANSVH